MTLVAGLLLLQLCAQGEGLGAVEDDLRRARNEYAYGNYQESANILHGLIYPMRLRTDAQVIEARQYLALSYYLLGKRELVRDEFAKLLYLDPDYELDPYAVAPPVIEIFERVRRELKPELDIIRGQKSDEMLQSPTPPGSIRIIEHTHIERSEFATLMPFGIGQFQNGDIGLGVVFGATQLALLGVNIGAYLWARNMSTYQSSERPLVQALTVAQFASIGLFGGVWAVSVFHARLNFVPTIVQPPVVRDELAPTGLLGGLLSPGMVLEVSY